MASGFVARPVTRARPDWPGVVTPSGTRLTFWSRTCRSASRRGNALASSVRQGRENPPSVGSSPASLCRRIDLTRSSWKGGAKIAALRASDRGSRQAGRRTADLPARRASRPAYGLQARSGVQTVDGGVSWVSPQAWTSAVASLRAILRFKAPARHLDVGGRLRRKDGEGPRRLGKFDFRLPPYRPSRRISASRLGACLPGSDQVISPVISAPAIAWRMCHRASPGVGPASPYR
jgi:hypothetical protein